MIPLNRKGLMAAKLIYQVWISLIGSGERSKSPNKKVNQAHKNLCASGKGRVLLTN